MSDNRGDAMKSNTVIKLAVSAAIVAVPTTGCAGFMSKQSGISKTADAGYEKAAKWSAKAEKNLANSNPDKAVFYAEKAVEADFHNSAYRSTLARGYIAQGRFISAERTLQDVLDLGQSDPRTIISLALLRAAQGKSQPSISLLDANRNILPAGDYGLALAVAGDNKRAVETLENTIRVSNTVQVRQNLALAYALNGQWREARIMASQDLTGSEVSDNIVEWAKIARPDAYKERVASLLGVSPSNDSGQPVRLALDSRSNANIDLAANISSDDELPAIGPAPKSIVDTAVTAKEDDVKISSVKSSAIPSSEVNSSNGNPSKISFAKEAAPLIKAPKGPSKIASVKPKSKFVIEKSTSKKPVAKKPVKLALVDTKPRKTASRRLTGGAYLVQLGAFSSEQNAQRAWGELQTQHKVLAPFQSTSSTVNSNGRKLYRLSAMGFGNKDAATSVCDDIKSKGGSCIVRKNTGGSPTRLANAKTSKIASRK